LPDAADGRFPSAASGDHHDQDFWNRPLSQLTTDLRSNVGGLSSHEAAARLLSVGPNVLQASIRFGRLRRLARRFANPLVLILLGAATISALTGDLVSSGIIIVMVLLGIVLDTIQEERADLAAERLRQSVELVETVLRDGHSTSLPAHQIVPGDVVLLCAGDLVPADGRLIETDDYFVNEAALTGEPFPVEKHPQDIAAADLAGAANAVFMGSSVVGGSAKFLVCSTGSQTQLGRIAGSLRRRPPPAALERGTFRFGLLIARLTVLLALCALLFNLLRHHPLLESFLFAVALAVGLTPELLPMIVSVTLARGAMRLGRRRVIVKRLAAVHDLGAMDVLCTDKTGTLTEARIKLVRHVDFAGKESEHAYFLALLNSRFEAGLKSPLDEAILKHPSAANAKGWRKIDEVPFDFERRRVSVLLEGQGQRLLVLKGAPEDVLRLCTRYETTEGAVAELDAQARDLARSQCESLGKEGFRLLAVASREMDPSVDHAAVSDETGLILAGFTAFLDPPKQSASAAIADLARAGVAVKILTGDNELVTRHVCASLGLSDAGGVLLGSDVDRMGDDALMARVEKTDIFCRVTPAQKNRVILALRRRGRTVGFLGDGINDAPALHSADVGVSVDSAVDVAKDAADLILLDQDLEVVVDGVREGRRTFGNIMKYVMMATSSNFGNMFSMAAAALILPFLPMLPIQVLLNNLLYDISEVAIPLDQVDDADLARPRHWDIDFVRNFMLVLGPVSSIFDFLTFAVLLLVFHADAALFHTGWFIESLATQTLVIFVIRTRGSALKSRPHPALVVSSLGMLALALVAVYSPLGGLLGFVSLPATFLAALAVLTAAYLFLAEAVKRLFYRHLNKRPTRRPPGWPSNLAKNLERS
jgi:Mg2+-importing ATPase